MGAQAIALVNAVTLGAFLLCYYLYASYSFFDVGTIGRGLSTAPQPYAALRSRQSGSAAQLLLTEQDAAELLSTEQDAAELLSTEQDAAELLSTEQDAINIEPEENDTLGADANGGGDERNLTAIPFWVYDGPEFEVYKSCKIIPQKSDMNHVGELYFLKQLEDHPWRVTDPQNALLFVVPIPLSAVWYKTCGALRDRRASMVNATEAIKNSWQFKRNFGWDHLLVGTDWRIHRFMPGPLRRIATNFTVGHKGYFEPSPWRCVVNSGHASNGRNIDQYPLEQTIEQFNASRKYTFFFQGRTEQNRGYEIRRRAMKSLPGLHSPNMIISVSKNTTYGMCGDSNLEGCQAGPSRDGFHSRLRKAKFQLFFRGDDFASARLYDALWEGTPSIVFSDEIWTKGLPSQCQVPWEQMTFRGSEKDFMEDPRAALENVYQYITDEDIKLRLDTMKRHLPDVLWDMPGSRVGTNILYNTARKCIPPHMLQKAGVDPDSLTCQYNDPSLAVINNDAPST